ncbi:sucrose phosphorylase [Propionicicella superfundia]|uniref:sucrose phosphorylase n=1 Tax=Propionicicella superfundia TaxID=348582 RepID=UPI000411416B|nr:sucrose phosphorylase [Propionicicella superfundia]
MESDELTGMTGIPTGDMPGDKVQITQRHVDGARAILPRLNALLAPVLADPARRAVVAVHGGSGVGKSEIGALLAHHLRQRGVGAYVLSGDNYPRRIPAANDAERLWRFRVAGVRALAASGAYGAEEKAALAALQAAGQDADRALSYRHPWLRVYQRAGGAALRRYIGTPDEIDFDEVNGILDRFHAGAATLTLKRMGRTPDHLWYDDVDVSGSRVIVLEWTHGNSAFLRGVDISVLLHSTPEETLAHRRARARDGAIDSPFTTFVLGIEQELLGARAAQAQIVLSRSGELMDEAGRARLASRPLPDAGPLLNVYPDSLAGRLAGTVDLVRHPAVAGAFASVYLLPSVFNTDLDRGFSVIDYSLSRGLVGDDDLPALAAAGLDLKLDVVLNHASVLSPQFQDLLAHGQDSPYADFFIDWNAFWEGYGEMTPGGYVQPRPEIIADMFFRKPGLPILMVRMPDGQEVPYWNTFYQEVRYSVPDVTDLMSAAGLQYRGAEVLAGRVAAALESDEGPGGVDFTGFEDVRDVVVDLLESRRRYLGQMDLNIASDKVWEFYADVLDTLASYGASIVRLDAFAYAPKEPGARNFLNEPGTWDLLARVRELADARGLTLLPEIHSRYDEGVHERIAEQGFLTYDFFLPGLVIDAFERRDGTVLRRWADELVGKRLRTVNMLGCHDGIPLLDLRGLLDDDRIDELISTVVARGGHVKDLHGQKQVYYQVNATYYSALGESDARLLLARAIQVFMPGKPQVWYLDLFAGPNDHAAVERAGAGGHKEVNRTNLTAAEVAAGLTRPVVRRQLDLLRFRTTFPAFGFDASCEVGGEEPHEVRLTWRRGGYTAELAADLARESFTVRGFGPDGDEVYAFEA